MTGYSIFPKATNLDQACYNLRALVKLVPSLKEREAASAQAWARLAKLSSRK